MVCLLPKSSGDAGHWSCVLSSAQRCSVCPWVGVIDSDFFEELCFHLKVEIGSCLVLDFCSFDFTVCFLLLFWFFDFVFFCLI